LADYSNRVDFLEDMAVVDMYAKPPVGAEELIVEISLTADRTVPEQFRVYFKLMH
jgi:hypothetical protein